MAIVCPLFSGSRGNSYYIGSRESGILLDAGRSARQIGKMLERCRIPMEAVKGIFITHEHADHIQGLRVLASKYHLPVFASAGTLQKLQQDGCLSGEFLAEEIPWGGLDFAGMSFQPFPTSHDSAESVGYRIDTLDGAQIGFATDLGMVTPEVTAHLERCKMVVLESNHDVGMLQNGSYPYPLKRRILSEQGHLSNEACAGCLPKLVETGTSQILLAHLSEENNTPDVARQTALCSLQMAGWEEHRHFQLLTAQKENVQGRSIEV